ncbi:M28 family metallopeptidase [Roseivirga sp. BDSF3-8]|uniref:M28 family metallopeptidase n=1 Tax=Roseivirga sp. BDSF3-8 TaxID=3241598 RepID=UPI00353201AB
MKYSNLLLAGGLMLAVACQSSEQEEQASENTAKWADSTAMQAIDAEGFAKHIETLASDEFEGRMPGTAGEEKTINYLKDEFQKLGLEPGNGDSFFQEVQMVEISSQPQGPMVVKNGEGESVSLDYLKDYVALTRRVQEQTSLENSELVFAGYGVVAPEYNWNDYEGLDVEGKTVVVMVNDPGFATKEESLFNGEAMTYYGRWTYKYEEAARQGAAGLLIIHDTEPASYPWSVVRGGWSGPALYLQAQDNNMSRAKVEGWISLESAKKLFALAGMDESLMEEASKPGFKAVPMGVTASLTLDNSLKESISNNVLALKRGAERRDEYIIYTAHWDHLGIGEPVDGDSIYNGAVDNATGTAALLELAEAFTELEDPQGRSILFLAVTAEEQGLLGSEYYATNPVYPLDKTVAVINMDALGNIGSTKDLIVVGYGQSELDDLAEAAAAKMDMHVTPDQNPGAGYFYRSDHFSFAKMGVPALYAESGHESREQGAEWGKAQTETYTSEHYHGPSDEYDAESWDMAGMVEYVQLMFDLGVELANSGNFPNYKEGSEFKAARDDMMAGSK